MYRNTQHHICDVHSFGVLPPNQTLQVPADDTSSRLTYILQTCGKSLKTTIEKRNPQDARGNKGRWSATVGRAGIFPEKALVVAGVPSKETFSGVS